MHRDEGGVTLIETLIVAAILVLILAGVYSFLLFGQKLYFSGAGQVELHGPVRLAAEKINRKLRFASEVELLGDSWDPGSAATDNSSYIYFDAGSREVILLDSDGSQVLSEGVITELTFSAEGGVLLFTIRGEGDSADFALESSVKPLNLSGNIGGPEGAQALRFSMPHGGGP